jgi:hypothetical protein
MLAPGRGGPGPVAVLPGGNAASSGELAVAVVHKLGSHATWVIDCDGVDCDGAVFRRSEREWSPRRPGGGFSSSAFLYPCRYPNGGTPEP